ncbi:MAG: kelch repeat-containing protein [Thermoplasmata archaeon]
MGRGALLTISVIVLLGSALDLGAVRTEARGIGPDPGSRSFSTGADATAPGAYIPGWSNITGPGDVQVLPGSRQGAAWAYDPALGRVVLYGGTGPGNVVLNDTWTLVPRNITWVPADPAEVSADPSHLPEPLPPLTNASMAYDAVDGYLLLFGGELPNGSAYNGTWSLSGSVSAGLEWTDLTPTLASGPGPCASPKMVYDNESGSIFLYTGEARNSTWQYHDGSWGRLPSVSIPPPRRGGALAYLPGDEGVLLFGGESIATVFRPSVALNDTWLYEDGGWSTRPLNGSPPALPYVGMDYDGVLDKVFVVAGGPTLQTWTLSPESWTSDWTNVTAAGPTTPSGRTGYGVLYDPVDGWTMLFGGQTWGSSSAELNDLWVWDHPASSQDPATAAAPIPWILWVGAALGGSVAIALAVVWVRWPRQRSSAPVPNGPPSAPAER